MPTKILQIVDPMIRHANDSDMLCGRGQEYYLNNSNLLDNSNFLNLVTYRSGYVESVSASAPDSTLTFKFDRWRVSKSVSAESNGLVMPTGTHYLQQGHPLHTLGAKKYTAVVTLDNGSKFGGVIDLTDADSGSVTDGIFTIALTKNYNSTFDRIYVIVAASVVTTITSIALYDDAFTVLPTYIARPYSEEFNRILPYFRVFFATKAAGLTYSNSLRVTFHLDVPMRTNTPIFTVKTVGTIVGNSKANNITTVTPEFGPYSTKNAIHLVIKSSATVNGTLQETLMQSLDMGVWKLGEFTLDADFR